MASKKGKITYKPRTCHFPCINNNTSLQIFNIKCHTEVKPHNPENIPLNTEESLSKSGKCLCWMRGSSRQLTPCFSCG